MNRNANANKILPLESLRGIAALSVLIYHFNIGSHFNNIFTKNAWLMVDFFFVLSGFVISLSYSKKIKNIGDFKKFQIRRFLRLYPLHIAIILIMVVLEVVKILLVKKGYLLPVNQPFSGNKSTWSLFMNVLLLQNITIKNLSWNCPSWSISSEFYTYILFSLVVLFAGKKDKTINVISIIFIVVANITLLMKGMGTDNLTGPARCVYSFFMGLMIYRFYDKNKVEINGLITMISIVMSIFIVSYADTMSRLVIVFIPISFAMTILLIAKTQKESFVVKFLSMRPLVFLGTISYGIYMWHSLVLNIIGSVSRIIFKVPFIEKAGGVYLKYSNIFEKDMVTVIAIITTITLSMLSYKYIERRFYSINIKI